MMTLDQMIAEAAKAGRLKALTLWPTSTGWQCNVRNQHDGWNCVEHRDPVAGLRAALTPGVPVPAPPKTGVFD